MYVSLNCVCEWCENKTCCSSIGSSAGSSSSPTFSKRHGLPNRTAFSRLRKKSLFVSFNTSKLLFFSCVHKLPTLNGSQASYELTYHALDPFVSLTLWVNEERPATRVLSYDTILNRQRILWKTRNLPATNLNGFSKSVHQVGCVAVRNTILSEFVLPELYKISTILSLWS